MTKNGTGLARDSTIVFAAGGTVDRGEEAGAASLLLGSIRTIGYAVYSDLANGSAARRNIGSQLSPEDIEPGFKKVELQGSTRAVDSDDGLPQQI